jgi:DNA-binding response OmpR family regulator
MKKILIADDETTLRFLVSETLKMTDGYQIIEASDGEDALTKFNKFNPDLVILDVMMPIMTGLDVAKELVKLENRPLIILLTAKTLPKDVDAGLEIGVDYYLQKPFSPVQLLELVNNILPVESTVE